MTDKEAMKLALDALIWTTGSGDFSEGGQAHDGAKKCLFPAITALKEQLADHMREVQRLGQEIEQEPPQREWVGLTDEEMKDSLISVDAETKRLPPGMKAFSRAIEAKLKEKNT